MYFPVGDIHGDYAVMKLLYDRIIEEIASGCDPIYGGTIVFLGDYIDRGSDSKEVLDFLMALEDFEVNGYAVKHIILKGNHEEFMYGFRADPKNHILKTVWMGNGGEDTIKSFDATLDDIVDGKLDTYIDWIEALPCICYDVDYVFVHAGIDAYKPADAQSEHICLWAGDRNHMAYKDYPKVVIHGHMTRPDGPIVDMKNNRIWMDTGMGMFGKAHTVCLPEPFDYGYDNDGEYKVIEVVNT